MIQRFVGNRARLPENMPLGARIKGHFAYCLHGAHKEITQLLCFRIEAD